MKEAKINKIGKWAARLVFVALLIGLSVSLILFPPSFLRVKEVVVLNSPKHISHFDLVRLAGISKGVPLLTLKLKEVRGRILRYPWIEDVLLTKRFPGRLLVEVQEQVPLALLELDALYLVNDKGVVFKKLEAGEPKDLPILTGMEKGKLTAQLPSLIAVLKHFNGLETLKTIGLSEIHRNQRGDISLFTREPCIRIEMGSDEWKERLDRLALAWGTIRATAGKIKVVDLSYEKRIIVKQGV